MRGGEKRTQWCERTENWMCAAINITKQRAHNLFSLQHKEVLIFITALISNSFSVPKTS